MVRALGIDFGTKRIGLAISFASLAEPLTIIENNDEVIARIQHIITTKKIGHLVCGLSEGEMAKKTQLFATNVAQITGLPLTFVDETLSSQSVRKKVGSKRLHNNRRPIDHLAATEILQDWLDQEAPREYA